MRELKFRIWVESHLKEETGLYYPDSLVLYKNGSVDYVRAGGYKFKDDTCKFTLQQFIGFQDKNEVDIYEGDIVKLFGDDEEIFEVTYDDYDDFPSPRFILDAPNGRGDWFSKKDREVIGNVFENPELKCF